MGPKEWNCPTSVILNLERAQLKLRVVSVSLTQTSEVKACSVTEGQGMGSGNDVRSGWWQNWS